MLGVGNVEPTLQDICDPNTIVIDSAPECRLGEPRLSSDDVGGFAGLGKSQPEMAQGIGRDVLQQHVRSDAAYETKPETCACRE